MRSNWSNWNHVLKEPNYLIDPSFQEVNRFFVLLFENNYDRTEHAECFLPKAEIKDYNALLDGQNFLISQLRVICEHMITFEKSELVKEMII